jgi:predicted DNA-binding mobile mystery protein A
MSDKKTNNARIEQAQLRQGMKKSWIKSMRLQHNLQGKQLADKMGVSPARISVLEKDEQRGAVTLKMMQKAAAALDCEFVYALVPKNRQPTAKPRIRLDSSSLKGDNSSQVADLEQAFQQKLLRTIRD